MEDRKIYRHSSGQHRGSVNFFTHKVNPQFTRKEMIRKRVKLEDINPEALAKLFDAIEIELRKRKEPAATGSIRKEIDHEKF